VWRDKVGNETNIWNEVANEKRIRRNGSFIKQERIVEKPLLVSKTSSGHTKAAHGNYYPKKKTGCKGVGIEMATIQHAKEERS